MARVSFFIDGFNVYHSLKNPAYRRFLWLDYSKFLKIFVRPQDTLQKILYFSAFAHWRPDAVKRHRLLIDAWKASGVEVVMGLFKDKDRFCNRCKAYYLSHEEKETDVNIAIHLVKGAFQNEYDTAILVTNDTDLIPAIRMVKGIFPQKKIGVLFPIDRWSSELNQVADFMRKTQKKYLSRSQFPDKITLPSGVELSKPASWN